MRNTVIIVVAVIAFLIIGGVWYVWQEMDSKRQILDGDATSKMVADVDSLDTENWQTHRNEEWGFEIKYPNNFIKGPILKDGKEIATSYYPEPKDKNKDVEQLPILTIYRLYLYSGGDVVNPFASYIESHGSMDSAVDSGDIYGYGVKNINGHDAEYVIVGSSAVKAAIYYFTKDSKQIALEVLHDDAIAEAILSTFISIN